MIFAWWALKNDDSRAMTAFAVRLLLLGWQFGEGLRGRQRCRGYLLYEARSDPHDPRGWERFRGSGRRVDSGSALLYCIRYLRHWKGCDGDPVPGGHAVGGTAIPADRAAGAPGAADGRARRGRPAPVGP